MSRHLQVLPSLRSTAAKLRHPAAGGKENAVTNIIQVIRKRNRKWEEKQGKGESDEEIGIGSCETPKSEKNRIPETVACPAAPRKAARGVGVVSCKRKLMAEFEYFESDRREEVDEFFRSSFERISAANVKRRISTRVVNVDAAAGCAVEADCSSSSTV